MSVVISLTDGQAEFLERILRTWSALTDSDVSKLDAKNIILKIEKQWNAQADYHE